MKQTTKTNKEVLRKEYSVYICQALLVDSGVTPVRGRPYQVWYVVCSGGPPAWSQCPHVSTDVVGGVQAFKWKQ